MGISTLSAIAVPGLFGLVFGSFANVVIWRVPRGESIVSPPSHCPRCGHPVRWYDNLPVVSWLVLRGRCRDCGEAISARYPLVELASGVLWALAGWRWGASGTALSAALFFYLLLVLSVIDLDTHRLPTPIVSWLAGIGLTSAVASQLLGVPAGPLIGVAAAGWLAQPLVSAVAGLVFGGGIALAVAGLYAALRGRAGLGFGDVRLLGAMGLFLGPYVVMAYVLGNLLGLAGILLFRREPGRRLGEARIPFGPFLAAGALITALAGPGLLGAYLRLVGIA